MVHHSQHHSRNSLQQQVGGDDILSGGIQMVASPGSTSVSGGGTMKHNVYPIAHQTAVLMRLQREGQLNGAGSPSHLLISGHSTCSAASARIATSSLSSALKPRQVFPLAASVAAINSSTGIRSMATRPSVHSRTFASKSSDDANQAWSWSQSARQPLDASLVSGAALSNLPVRQNRQGYFSNGPILTTTNGVVATSPQSKTMSPQLSAGTSIIRSHAERINRWPSSGGGSRTTPVTRAPSTRSPTGAGRGPFIPKPDNTRRALATARSYIEETKARDQGAPIGADWKVRFSNSVERQAEQLRVMAAEDHRREAARLRGGKHRSVSVAPPDRFKTSSFYRKSVSQVFVTKPSGGSSDEGEDLGAYETATFPTTNAYLETMGIILRHMISSQTSQDESSNVDAAGSNISRFDGVSVPDVPIDAYLERLRSFFSCSPECFVLAMIYVDRLIKMHHKKVILKPVNIHRIIVTALMLAAKYFDDVYYSNSFYAKIGGISCLEMNVLESHFLNLIKYNLYVSPREYERYRRDVTRLHPLSMHSLSERRGKPREVSDHENTARGCYGAAGKILAPSGSVNTTDPVAHRIHDPQVIAPDRPEYHATTNKSPGSKCLPFDVAMSSSTCSTPPKPEKTSE